jgi:protein-disulfide isomerase
MRLSRRTLLTAATLASTAGSVGWSRTATAADDPRMGERSLGPASAKVTVIECFSLTCTHCAAFSRETMPQVKTELIDTGRIRYVFRDFPLDQVALVAAMVARAVPADRYEPFISALFASQDRWAFARGANTTEELWKTAALAGMPRATFDSTIADNTLKQFILSEQDEAVKTWHVDSTPSFIVNGQKTAGEMGFDAFKKLVTDAGA